MSGSGSGIVDAIKTIIPAPFGSMDAAQLQGAPGDINPVIAGAQIPGTGFGDMGSAFSSGSAGPNGNGAQVDQSINFNAPVGTGVDQAMQKAQSAQNQQYRRNNGTRTMPS
ncbi:Putative phage tail tape measure protein TMP [Mycobacteroides abscessus]|nr:Putative phage tail tape measure protein TMP [Mycobacteroides abscessus]CPX77060.1 Putative phage tail tape measure protein TMP [Mycobacteroides abscessus]